MDRLGELIEAGVYSFKIEGRMKSPEYVAVVTRIYRKYIDEYMEKGSYHVTPEDRRELRRSLTEVVYLGLFDRKSGREADVPG